MTNNANTKPSFWSRKLILGTTISSALIFFIVGIIFWGGFNTAMEATNTTEFCIGCHEMEDNVYQEYKPTIHYTNRTGVRAGCPDCHVPRPWIHKVVRKIQASREVYFWLTGKIDTKEKFEEHRFELAQSVWKAMKNTDSRECRNCHNFESMNPEFQKPRARKQHLNAFETGQTCIDCHKGIAHHDVRDKLSDEALEKLEAPNPAYIREIPQEYKDGLARIEAKEAEAEALVKAEALEEKAKVEAKIAAAVAAAVANTGSAAEKVLSTSNSASSEKASTINVDWSKANSADIGVFYPGTASIEWILGRNHGGKRAFTKGDRCIDCHGKEIADIGQKIVSGESEKELEPNVIPGKRGSFPVTIDATHDAENLYLRFSWADGEHAPVPFVDGGKMDPENPMKLAFMLATDDVEYADRAGCWGTCHADANTMPFAPEQAVLKGSDLAQRLNLNTGGVTKYITESRTELELKGRGGKALGGWDKLKDEGEITAAQNANQFMDLVRYKSGTGEVEDGQILATRDMHKGMGATVEASLKNGTWSVVVQRKLKSDQAGDVSIEAGKVYNFGFAIHDDYSSARYHHVSFGYKLALDNDKAEINAKAQ